MMLNEIENNVDLQRILWACYKYWESESSTPHEKRLICYSWVVRLYKDRFGSRFHQSKLHKLASLGLLQKDDTSRGGNRRYYKMIDPNGVFDLLKKWQLV